MVENPKIALTISGIDSGGAAGLHSEIKTFNEFGVYGVSAITVLTAQNSERVVGALWSSPEFLDSQLEAVLTDYGCDAAKTGLIGKVELVETIASVIERFNIQNLVVDPVLVNHRGEAMFPKLLTDAYKSLLLPSTICLTPNVSEAILLSGKDIHSEKDAMNAAEAIHREGAENVLIKKIRQAEKAVDLLSLNGNFTVFTSEWLDTINSHGSGDTLSSAITACLAKGEDLVTAITQARSFTQRALIGSKDWTISKGHGPLKHY